MHRRGFAHLDLKPENVVLQDGRPMVVDLGSSRLLGRPQPPGRPIGTSGYTAPDLEAARPIAAAMDAFGIGVTLAEAALGCPLFDPVTPPSERPGVAEVLAGLDPASGELLRGLLSGLLEPDPERRLSCDAGLAQIDRIAVRGGWEDLTWPRRAGQHLTSLTAGSRPADPGTSTTVQWRLGPPMGDNGRTAITPGTREAPR
jgi:serine/threonine protein kinase